MDKKKCPKKKIFLKKVVGVVECFSVISFLGTPKRYHYLSLLSILFFSTGCSTNWGFRPDLSHFEEDQRAYHDGIQKRVAEFDKTYPEWANMTTNEEIVIEYYDKNGKKIGSAIAH